MHLTSLFLASSAFLGALAAPSPSVPDPRSISKRCVNSAEDRSCWGDYDLSTDYYTTVPDTGVTREYWWDVANTTGAPDGYERELLIINGSFPGPTLFADWGDEIVVHVTNSMQNNGTSIHFHGIRQNYTNYNDGVTSVTQCPLAPGASMTYKWRATQYGTSWYHSHFGVQAWDGIFGAIVIYGPSSVNYDVDLGVLLLNDWSYDTSEQQEYYSEREGPPTQNTGLINGTNVSDYGGYRYNTTFVAGTRYLFRVVNAAADTFFRLSIDNHTMEVATTDFVAIDGFNTTNLAIAIGQRYNVVVTASQTSGNFWMRAVPQTECSDNDNTDNIRGIIRYDSSSTADPTSTSETFVDECVDEPLSDLTPYFVQTASANPTVNNDYSVSVAENDENLFYWNLAPTSYYNDWDYPSVLQIADGNHTWSSEQSTVNLTVKGEWVYFIIETSLAVSHPIHLHGHDFSVLAVGTGTYADSNSTLLLANPPRRDVATLQAEGFLVIAFEVDNPGAWIMHCHIAYHAVEGLALQLIELESEISSTNNITQVTDVCATWDTYYNADVKAQSDDGI